MKKKQKKYLDNFNHIKIKDYMKNLKEPVSTATDEKAVSELKIKMGVMKRFKDFFDGKPGYFSTKDLESVYQMLDDYLTKEIKEFK